MKVREGIFITTRPAAGRNESPHRTGLVPFALALSSRHLGTHSTAIFINHENFLKFAQFR